MIQIKKEFESKDVTHILLDPRDVESLSVVLKNAIRVINKEFPWDNDKAKEGTLQILQWQLDILNETYIKSTKL